MIWMKPYKDTEITNKYIIREFKDDIDPIELLGLKSSFSGFW